MMNNRSRIRRPEESCYVVIHVLAWVMNPLYHFNLVTVPVGVILAVVFFGLVTVSGMLAWTADRASRRALQQ